MERDREEYTFKVLVVGEISTGKTSIINRYVHNTFSEHYKSTLGVDFALKVLHFDKRLVRLQLRDIAGQERSGSMTRVYYKDASSAFIVFDLTRPQTFEAAKLWKKDIDEKVKLPDGSLLPVILLANKCDLLDPSRFAGGDLDTFCKDNGFEGWFPCSAKENRNISEAICALVEKMMSKANAPKPQADASVFTPSANDGNQKNDKKCEC